MRRLRPVQGRKLRTGNSTPQWELDAIMDAIHDDVLIADGKGIVIKVSETFEQVYNIRREEAIGRSVYELEEAGYFRPSITAMVLESGRKITMSQKNNRNRSIVVTATPVMDKAGNILKVVSFSRDVTEFLNLKEQYSELETRMERYEKELGKLRRESFGVEAIIAKDEKSQAILKTIRRIAPFDTNVLLTGESGVGKSLFARIIHNHSPRVDGPFIEINCGAIPENLLESELFGYEQGSFTGAGRDGKIGLIELAQNGTLFLDEIGELPMNLQVKILKVIQDKVIQRVGGIRNIEVDFRLITATNKDLTELMEKKVFREDLYYRLNVISLEIPPLRERREDIVPMIAFFVDAVNKRYGIRKIVSREAFHLLSKYDWPGNIRELENLMERIMLIAESEMIRPEDLPEEIWSGSQGVQSGPEAEPLSLTEAVEALERDIVSRAWERTGTTVGVAALLHISQPTAVRKIQKYIDRPKKSKKSRKSSRKNSG